MQFILENKILSMALGYIIFVLSASIHEYSHARSAFSLGDQTALNAGRLTVNPLKHIDILGTVILPIMASITGLPVIGWMKPVPTNPNNYRGSRERGMAITAFAGPLSNFSLSLIAFILIKIITMPVTLGEQTAKMPLLYSLLAQTNSEAVIRILAPLVSIIAVMLFYFYMINIFLMVFNLLPFPPLDGGWILRYLLPQNAKRVYDKVYPFGFVILYAMMFFGLFRMILRPIQTGIFELLGNSLPILFSY